MLPLIILAGALAVAGGVGLYHLAKSSEKEERERKQHEEYLKSRNISHPVELVSVNYRGRKKYSRIVASISTDWYASLDRAEDELCELARQHGCDMVINVIKEKDTQSEPTEKGGTYYYTVWRLAGEAVIC